MYQGILQGLAGLLVLAGILGATGVISVKPVALLISVVTLATVCYASNVFFGWLFRAPRNTESYLITALILACILPPPQSLERVGLIALTGVIAMASKYLLVYRGSHVFNPAALGAFVVSVSGLLPVIWWVATPWLIPYTVILAVLVLRKQRRFALFFTFAITALAMMSYVGVLQDQPMGEVLRNAVLSWPILFMGSVMLTEPTTLPATKRYQLLMAVLVGAVFSSQLHIWEIASNPQTALIIGNLFALFVTPTIGLLLRLKETTQVAPNVYDLVFEPIGRKLPFQPGQYLEWTLPHKKVDARGNRRIFSIASSPSEKYIHLGTKTYDRSSSFKNALLAMKPGKVIRVAHPAGSFTLPLDTSRKLAFIAGGIGITPFRSMVQSLSDNNDQRDVTLLYGERSPELFAYKSVFNKSSITTKYITGAVDASHITNYVPDFKDRLFYVSGPHAMVQATVSTLKTMGVTSGNIKTDHFTGYA